MDRDVPYDALDEAQQALLRAAWDHEIAARVDGLDFEDRLRRTGSPWPEADSDGRVVVRDPRGGPPDRESLPHDCCMDPLPGASGTSEPR